MDKPLMLLEQAAALRSSAMRAFRLAQGLIDADRLSLVERGENLRAQATELERQAAAEIPARPADPDKGTELDAPPPNRLPARRPSPFSFARSGGVEPALRLVVSGHLSRPSRSGKI